MDYQKRDLRIFSANSNPKLAEDIAKELGCDLGKSKVGRFSDGEISVSIYESVRGADCFIVQSTCAPVNDNLMELLLMVDAAKRARQFATRLGCPIALIDKRRPKANVSQVMNIIGDIKDKKIILVDDIMDTAGTLCHAAEAVIEKGGAKEVYAYVAHPVLSGNAVENLKNSCIKKIIALNTIDIPKEKMLDNFTVLNVAPIFSEAIKRINGDKPMSTMILE